MTSSQCDSVDSDKERHSSGDSQDSALSTSPPSNDTKVDNKAKNGVDIYVDTLSNVTPKTTESLTSGNVVPTRGILKTSSNRGRCFSESNAERLTSSPSLSSFVSMDSSIPEENEDEDDDCSFNIGNGKPLVHRPREIGTAGI